MNKKIVVGISVFVLVISVIWCVYYLFQIRRDCRENFPSYPLTLDEYRDKAYQIMPVQTLQELCYKKDAPYCFFHPKTMEQFRKSIKLIAKDAIMYGIRNKDYYYLVLIALKINSLELRFKNYEDCLFMQNNAYGNGVTTSIIHQKDSLRKLTLLRVSDLLKIFDNDALRLNTDKEIEDKIKERKFNKEDAENYREFYGSVVKPLLNDKEFKDNMNFNQTENMPIQLFAKYVTAVYLSNYLFETTDEKCDEESENKKE
jgi:hypothetical protein